MNSRLDTLQAAVLIEKLKFFDEEVRLCDQAAEEYTRQLRGFVKTPVVREDAASSWAQYTICFPDSEKREQAVQRLNENHIPSAVYYRKPMHRQKAFESNDLLDCGYSVTENICSRCLSLPMHAYMDQRSIRYVCDILMTNDVE